MSPKEIIIDTGFFVALLCETDQFHHSALQARKYLNSKKWISTWPVLTETAYLLNKFESFKEFEKILALHEMGLLEIFDIKKIHVPLLKSVLKKYQKLPIDLADASLLILAEELGHGEIVSTDQRHFGTYRWKNHKPFTNLLNEG